MTYEERRRSVISDPDRIVERSVGTVRPSWSTVAARIIAVIFGVIQALIGLRIVLLALNAREGNDLVRAILDLSQLFVAPFEGILHTNAISANGSVLDLAAVVAIIGWTLVELLLLAIVRIARPGDDV